MQSICSWVLAASPDAKKSKVAPMCLFMRKASRPCYQWQPGSRALKFCAAHPTKQCWNVVLPCAVMGLKLVSVIPHCKPRFKPRSTLGENHLLEAHIISTQHFQYLVNR